MPIPILVIGAAFAGAAIGACITRIMDESDGYLYHEDGYDREGFDREGFDRNGFDRNGYARDGYNAEGFDRNGFDRNGRDRQGYDPDGLDMFGRNRKGFDRAGWNESGRDITGHDAAYYRACASEIKKRASKAEESIAAGDCEHASLEIRKGAEQAVMCIISHTLGIGRYKRHFESDINACKGILDNEMIGKLHALRRTCGDQLHISVGDVDGLQIDAKYIENLQSSLRFCVKTLEEVLSVVEGYAAGA